MAKQPFPICPCAGCMAEWLEWAELVHDMDNLAARDPEPDARREFAEWAEQAEGGAA